MLRLRLFPQNLVNFTFLIWAGLAGPARADDIAQTRQILLDLQKITQLQHLKQVELEKKITQLKAEAGILVPADNDGSSQTMESGLAKAKQLLTECRGRLDKIELKKFQDQHLALSSKMSAVGNQILSTPNYPEVRRFVNEKLIIPMTGRIEWTRQLVIEAEASLNNWRKDILAEPCRLYGGEYCI
jgi:hypothetical protein